jgi:hypothetical protein
LDEFEGWGYKRILAMFELENGEAGVGYIYAINVEDGWSCLLIKSTNWI